MLKPVHLEVSETAVSARMRQQESGEDPLLLQKTKALVDRAGMLQLLHGAVPPSLVSSLALQGRSRRL